jgi:hypothetical protein
LLAALWLRLLVPVGWMPAAVADGPLIILCSGGTLPGPGEPVRDHGAPCAFAGLSAPFVVVAAVLLVLPLLLFFMPVPAPVPAVSVRQRPPRPPSQGPPLA